MCTVLAEGFTNSRYELVLEFLKLGYEVILTAPEPVQDTNVHSVFKNKEVKYYKIDLERTGINPIADYKLIKQLQRIISNEKPDITYAFGGAKAAIYTSIVARKEKVPGNYCMINGLGSIFHGDGIRNKQIKIIMSMLFKQALSKSKGVLFQNTDDLKVFVDLNLVDSQKCIIVNGSGVNLLKFPYTQVLSENIFLFVGRLLKDKGIYEFVEATKIVKQNYPDAEFWIVGGYDANPTAVKEIEMSGWIDSGVVKYFGRQENVLSFYQECSVFVLPSYHEGTPRTNLEAMAVGRPIITTDAPGCKETVVDGVNGFLIPVKDTNALAGKMKWMIANADEAKVMGANSRAICEEKYDVHRVNKTIVEFLLK